MQSPPTVSVIGGGPAGLAAAETLAAAGVAVNLFDAMPSVGRKFLLAGVGGLNLTHTEEFVRFVARYGERAPEVGEWLAGFTAGDLRAWAAGLGVDTFVGSSGRVFPTAMKAAPLLRAWLKRLRANGVKLHVRHRWLGWDDDGALVFAHPEGTSKLKADATVLALGGASWSRLGSDGAWQALLTARGVAIAPLKPANCGFDARLSDYFFAHFAGQPVKSVSLGFVDASGRLHARRGELMVSNTGLEGSLIYALSAGLRDTLAAQGQLGVTLDLAPDKSAQRVLDEVAHPRGSRSLASHLQSRAGLKGVKLALLREVLGADGMKDMTRLAATIKALPLTLTSARPLDEAISTAGGVRFDALDENLQLRAVPRVFCAGEMLDWEAPTGGYLLTACFASGHAVAGGVLADLAARLSAPL